MQLKIIVIEISKSSMIDHSTYFISFQLYFIILIPP